MPKKGYIQTKEHRLKKAESSKGKIVSNETKEKIRLGNLGKKQTEEAKQRIRESKIGSIPWNKGKKDIYSEKTLQKMRTSAIGKSKNVGKNNPMYGKSGELSPHWNGGSSFLPYPPEFNKELKQFIFKRDNYICQNPYCDSNHTNLHIHHIDYDKNNNYSENLIVLCNSCHAKTNGKNNREWWFNYYSDILRKRLVFA